MKTDDLVVMLATGAGIAPKHVAARRYTIALGWGMPISFALMLTTIGLLSDIKGALVLPGFWIKFGFVVSLAAVSLLATLRLSPMLSTLAYSPCEPYGKRVKWRSLSH